MLRRLAAHLALLGSFSVSACSATLSSSTPDSSPDGGPTEQADSGLCNGGTRVPQVHRAQASACSSARGSGDQFTPRSGDECTSDATCTTGSNGRCLFLAGNGHCSYDACTSDTDCTGGAVCDCRPSGTSNRPNICLGGDCRVDTDCGATGYCSRSEIPGAIPVWEGNGAPGFSTVFSTGYFCHTANDCCIDKVDCAPNGTHYDYCLFAKDRWMCGGGP